MPCEGLLPEMMILFGARLLGCPAGNGTDAREVPGSLEVPYVMVDRVRRMLLLMYVRLGCLSVADRAGSWSGATAAETVRERSLTTRLLKMTPGVGFIVDGTTVANVSSALRGRWVILDNSAYAYRKALSGRIHSGERASRMADGDSVAASRSTLCSPPLPGKRLVSRSVIEASQSIAALAEMPSVMLVPMSTAVAEVLTAAGMRGR